MGLVIAENKRAIFVSCYPAFDFWDVIFRQGVDEGKEFIKTADAAIFRKRILVISFTYPFFFGFFGVFF